MSRSKSRRARGVSGSKRRRPAGRKRGKAEKRRVAAAAVDKPEIVTQRGDDFLMFESSDEAANFDHHAEHGRSALLRFMDAISPKRLRDPEQAADDKPEIVAQRGDDFLMFESSDEAANFDHHAGADRSVLMRLMDAICIPKRLRKRDEQAAVDKPEIVAQLTDVARDEPAKRTSEIAPRCDRAADEHAQKKVRRPAKLRQKQAAVDKPQTVAQQGGDFLMFEGPTRLRTSTIMQTTIAAP